MEREVWYAPEGGYLVCPSSPNGEGNWNAVRAIEVGDPGRRRKEAGFHVPVLSAFLPLTGTSRWQQLGRVPPAGAEVPGTPRRANEAQDGFPQSRTRTRTWLLSLGFQLAP